MSDRRRYAALESLRKIESRDFTLSVKIVREGQSAPPVRPLRERVEASLAGLDREDISRRVRAGFAHMPELALPAGDWQFRFRPVPRPDHRVGKTSPTGAISISAGRAWWGSDWGRLRDALREKARAYGRLDRPFVIAVLVGGVFVDDEDVVSAIYGEPVYALGEDADGDGLIANLSRADGLWSNQDNPGVSAVLVARHLVPESVNKAAPTLWRNPHARHPLDLAFPFAAEAALTTSGQLVIEKPNHPPSTYFDLPPEWPGPEKPFAG